MTLALALFVLVAPLDLPGAWGWAFVGGPYEGRQACEEARADRLDQDRVLCVRLGQ